MPTLKEAVEEYLAARAAEYSARTVQTDRVVLMGLLRSAGDIQMRNVDTVHARKFLNSRALAASSRNHYRSKLSSFFTWCRDVKYMPAGNNPLAGTRSKPVEAGDKLRVPAHRFNELLDACPTARDRIIVALGLYLMVRVSEIKTLTYGDLDLTESTIVVHVHKTSQVDAMYVCKELDVELRRWLLAYQADTGAPLEPSHYLVPGRKGGRICWVEGRRQQSAFNLTPTTMVSRVEAATQRALTTLGFQVYREGGHTLRRSGARALYDQLVLEGRTDAIRVVQAMLHHKTQSMTERYIGITQEKETLRQRLRGQEMFPKDTSNVVPLRALGG